MARFPRWRVWWRIYSATETTLGSLPVALLIPLVAALIGTAYAASHPSELIRRGLVVHQASFGRTLVTGLFGGVVGLLALVGLVFMATLTWYRLRGDPTWDVRWRLGSEAVGDWARVTRSTVGLFCTGKPPVDVSLLGHVEAIVKLPSGNYYTMAQDGMGPTGDGLWFWVPAPNGLGGPPAPGNYEVRWYGTTPKRKQYEITRSRFAVPALPEGSR
jgi:hypothetical protein